MASQSSTENSGSRLASDLQGDAAQAASHLRSGAADLAGKAMSTAKEYGQQGYDYVSDQAGAIRKSTESLVKKNPWYAIGIAVGAGMLLGLMLRGRSRD